jgi:hypothetical protein
MSFGYSVGDFIAIGQLTWTIYRSCKSAPGEFQELSRELSSLHTILHELEDEAQTPNSLLNRRGSSRKPELQTLLGNLEVVLKEIERYCQALSQPWEGPEKNMGPRQIWEREFDRTEVEVNGPYKHDQRVHFDPVCGIFG